MPSPATNEYRGHKLALYVFVLLTVVMLGRSLVHLLAEDGGINSIASIMTFPGDPDPDQVIYLFASLWGLHQTILATLYVVVIVRYRSLIPLMYVTLLVEWIGRPMVGGFLHPLGETFYERTPPGKTGTLPMIAITAVMLILSLRHTKLTADG